MAIITSINEWKALLENNGGDKLYNLLVKESQELKNVYIEKTKEWTKLTYEKAEEFLKIPNDEKYTSFGIPFKKLSNGQTLPDYAFSHRIHELRKRITNSQNITTMGYEKYQEKEVKYAEMHFDSSLRKLEKRIKEKELNIDNISVSSQTIGVNFNATITDGNKTVRAWTIIASGEIQRPHYRYLIK